MDILYVAMAIMALLQGQSAVPAHTVKAFLYNPSQNKIVLRYAYKSEVDTISLHPTLSLDGEGFPNGRFSLSYEIKRDSETLHRGKTEVQIENGRFETDIRLDKTYVETQAVAWQLVAGGNAENMKGYTPLSWSRFRGKVEYRDGRWRDSYIDLVPIRWGAPGRIVVPVAPDGHFDALVPARVYAVVNVNGSGYSYDALERWGWNYDLTKDRHDVFVIGRMELYGIRAFDIEGGPQTIFVIFRPTSLSRVLRWDADGDGRVAGDEDVRMQAAMKDSPTVIGPELKADDVTVWLNGRQERIVQFNKIPEYDGDHWQVQYLFQIFPDRKPTRGLWHEIKLEVQSREQLRGKEIVDFGQGSVGFFRR